MVVVSVGRGEDYDDVVVADDDDDNGGSGMRSKYSRQAIILAFITFSKAFLQHLALIVFLKECVHTCPCGYTLHHS